MFVECMYKQPESTGPEYHHHLTQVTHLLGGDDAFIQTVQWEELRLNSDYHPCWVPLDKLTSLCPNFHICDIK